MGEKIKVSVIIPVYNAKKYLEELIHSLLKQTLPYMEFIFINDGSTDDSHTLLEKYAQVDSRCIVINKENEGVSVARNIGLQRARGKYIGFVDADDFVADNMYELLYNTAEKMEADIVSCGYISYHPKKSVPALNDHSLQLSAEQAVSCILNNRILGMSVWNKVFKRECLQDTFFDRKYRINEDRLFVFCAACKSEKIAVIPDTLYYYRLNKESVSHARFSIANMDAVQVAKDMKAMTIRLYPNLEREASACVLRSAYHTLLTMYRSNTVTNYQTEHHDLVIEIKNTRLMRLYLQLAGRMSIQLLAIKYCEPFYRILKQAELMFKVREADKMYED